MRNHRAAAAAELRLQTALRERPPDRPPTADVAAADRPEPSLGEAAAVFRAAASAKLPTPVRDGIVDPQVHGAWTIVAMVVVAAVAAGVVLLRARPTTTPVAPPRLEMSAAGGSVTPSATASSSGTPGTVVVDVTGDVRRPGLFTLAGGSRVADAVRAAGGLRPGTRWAGVNLARRLVDGEQIVVGRSPVPGSTAGEGGPAPGGTDPPAEPVNLNTASAQQLDMLPGVGPVTAQRIVEWRTAHGGFTSVEQLQEIEGIGERKFASLRGQVTV